MIKAARFTISLFLLLMYGSGFAQSSLPGFWKGGVSRDGAIQPLEIYFVQQGDSVSGKYNLPDLGLFEEPVDITSVSDSTITIKLFVGSFDCFIDNIHTEITAENKKWKPVGVKLHLKKMIAPAPLFHKSEVNVPAGKTVLQGTLFTPAHPGKYPLLIIAHGAQDPNRRNWVYRYFAYLLPQYGYAVYVFDQRTESGIKAEQPSLATHADDLITLTNFFKNHSEIEGNRIGIIGESRGGWVAGMAAAQSSLIKTIILLAGPAKGPVELEYDVVKSSLTEEGYSKEQIDTALQYTRLYFSTIKDNSKWKEVSQQYASIRSREWATTLQEPVFLNDANMLWWKNNDHDTKEYLQKLKCPVLAFFGSADNLVPPQANISLMEQYFKASNKRYQIITVKDLPHGVYHNQTLINNEFFWPKNYWLWPKRSYLMEEAILTWLKTELKG